MILRNSFKPLFYFLMVAVVSWLINPGIAEQLNKEDISVGDRIYFGHYAQNYDGKDNSPIAWIVLERNKDTALIISEKVLELMPFHDNMDGALWGKSSIRKWLNNDFVNSAFSETERKSIIQAGSSRLINSKTLQSNDKIFFLDITEARKYFLSSDTFEAKASSCENIKTTSKYRNAAVTVFANREHVDYIPLYEKDNNISWWLRTSNEGKRWAEYVSDSNSMFTTYSTNCTDENGIRPALVLDLSKAIKIGTISKNIPSHENNFPDDLIKNESNNVTVKIKLKYTTGLFSPKYDISLYMDNSYLAKITAGNSIEYTARVEKGDHKLYLYKSDDTSINGGIDINVNEYSYLDGEINAGRNDISIKKYSVYSRYRDITDQNMLTKLKEYDHIIDCLYEKYNMAICYQQRQRADYVDHYFLINEENGNVLYFRIPKHIYDNNPVVYIEGYYKKIYDGKCHITLPYSKIIQIDMKNRLVGENRMELPDFEEACFKLSEYMFPQNYRDVRSVSLYLLENDMKMYDKIPY